MNTALNASPSVQTSRGVAFLTVVGVVAVLSFGKDFFLPLALAILISFLLAPVIRTFQRWRLGRIAAVILATVLAFSIIGGIGYMMAGQLMDLANTLPEYKSNLQAKIVSLKTNKGGAIDRATQTVRELNKELNKAEPDATAPDTPDAPSTPGAPATSVSESAPVPVEVVYTPVNAWESLKTFVAPVAAPLATAIVVIVLVIFMLLEREDLRDRVIHLVGRGRLNLTTQALDEAGARVSRYLVAQVIVNVTYGIPIGIGLWAIGIPNAVLWGALATVLRFVPYIGAWIAAAFPLALSLAIAPSWTAPLLALSLFIVIELISNNVVEPWLYGSSTGLSPMAIIVAAVFWTWLWGAIGLLLATPLTVCLAVLGKYIPSLSFLDVLLGEKPPIATSDRFYQRLLALDGEEVVTLAEEYAASHSLATTYEEVISKALVLVEADRRVGELDDMATREILRLVREVIIDLGDQELAKSPAPATTSTLVPLILPASNESDELAGLMLANLLALGGLKAELVSFKALAGEMVESAATTHPKLICISAVPPSSVLPAQHLCRRLHGRLGEETHLIVGLWNEAPGEQARRLDRFKRAQADQVIVNLAEAAREILLQSGVTPPAPVAVETKDA